MASSTSSSSRSNSMPSASSSASSSSFDDIDIVMVGGGPTGCLMATLFHKIGFRCVIFEKRKDPRRTQDQGKSINLTLSTRGLTALELLTESDRTHLQSLRIAVPCFGRSIHLLGRSNSYQPYSENPAEFLRSVNRRDLNNDLVTVAESNGVQIVFEHGLESIDFENNIATFVDASNNNTATKQIRFKVLFGADGSNSVVRKELQRVNKEPERTQKFWSGYKEFEMQPNENGSARLSPREALHVWPRGGANFFVAFPNIDNSFTCTLFSPSEGAESVAEMADEDVVRLFKETFPDVYAILGPEKIVSDHRANPFSGLYNVDVTKWYHKGSVVIMGDAAYGIVPYYGMGINAGMEGCRHMVNLVEMHRQPGTKMVDWAKVFAAWNQFKPHTDVLRAASLENAVELHKNVESESFLFQKAVERKLQRQYPRQFIEAHSLISFTNVPLLTCGRQVKVQEQVVQELCSGKTDMAEIDWTQAEVLVKSKLHPDLFDEKIWYARAPPNCKL